MRQLAVSITVSVCTALVIPGSPATADDRPSTPQHTDGNTLRIEQVHGQNKAVVAQGSEIDPSQVADAMGGNTLARRFRMWMPRTIGSSLGSGEVNPAFPHLPGAGRAMTVREMLTLPANYAGTGNTATIRQTEANNRAVALQAGSSNDMLIEQNGRDNLAVHVQYGNDNDTALIQEGRRNTTALVASHGTVAADQGTFTVKSRNGVRGFGVRTSGQQPYDQVTVTRRPNGGYDIDLTE